MSYFKFRILHFHISDLGHFAVQKSCIRPWPNASNWVLTKVEVNHLNKYAMDRGIRVVPEIDIPGHVRGFAPLADAGLMKWCDKYRLQISNDPELVTLTTLKKLLMLIDGGAFPRRNVSCWLP